MARETITYNNCKFHRYPDSECESDRKYYRGWVRIDGKLVKTYLHRYIWYLANGEIPAGYCVHHIDGDYNNNTLDNLTIMLADEHEKLHTELYGDGTWSKVHKGLEKAREKAPEWHASEDGQKWHSQNAKRMWKDKPMRQYVCEMCGRTFESNSQHLPKFCSNNCKAEWRRCSGVDDEERVCAVCGSKFVINRYSKTKCCSRKCSAVYRRNK
ncbi:HNH endonuclease signature motif containing protein [Bacteroides intestinalis]|uniref:HNH endonuclease signature motif containing protein n=1 Tax=Bacteroides intestinalis TaxID=329854 RepID=UPI0035BC44E0